MMIERDKEMNEKIQAIDVRMNNLSSQHPLAQLLVLILISILISFSFLSQLLGPSFCYYLLTAQIGNEHFKKKKKKKSSWRGLKLHMYVWT